MIKRAAYIIFLLSCFTLSKAQPYGNEWIDYSKVYYKFKIGKTSLYRISFSSLSALGIPSSQLRGTDFKIIRNGQEVPLYVSSNGQFGASDYIEFYGEKNDGKPDSALYKNPNNQPTTLYNIFSDTATFFLTLDPFSINARIIQQNNDIGLPPPKEEYCYHTVSTYGTGITPGIPASPYFRQLYNSDFDIGEGFSLGEIVGENGSMKFLVPNYVYKSPDVDAYLTARITFFEGPHKMRFRRSTLFDTTEFFFGPGVKTLNYSFNSQIMDNGLEGAGGSFTDMQTSASKSYLVGASVQYPRYFNFDNQSKFEFGILKKEGVYFEIRNYNNLGTNPVLYDLKNNYRYVGVVDSVVKFNLGATVKDKDRLLLSSQAATDIPYITSFSPVTFSSFLNSARQGNYLIITNKKLRSSVNGTNYVEEYRKYRSSVSGGGYNAQIYYIDELNDQFAYGISQHPLAIRNFVNFALDKFSDKPQLVFIIGNGFEYTYSFRNQGIIDRSLVQTYGEPASDNLLTARSGLLNYPQIGIGRLAALRGDDIKVYLDKVTEYESVLNDTSGLSQTPFNKSWMKNVLHLGGGNNNFEQQLFRSYLENYKDVIESPRYGARVASLFKNTTDPIQIAQNIFLDSLINTGVSLITFFGHSSTTTLDFNLEPERFDNKGKYHLMLSNGCFVGSIFLDPLYTNTYSSRFVLTPNKAAIGYIAPITYAISSNLNAYSTEFYNRFSNTMYNERIGDILKETTKRLVQNGGDLNPMIGHQMIYHGDPGLRINSHSKPDYYIDQASIVFEPQNINAATDSFLIKVVVRNLGAAVPDWYVVNVDRVFPNGQIQSTKVTLPSARNVDTVYLWIQSDRLNGPGLNTFKIKVDYTDAIAEYSETNNEVTVTKLIQADDIIPVFPYEFCMVNDPNFELVFSTASPFAASKQYLFQIDTTELFNSPLLTQVRLTQPGATIKWKPNIPLIQNKVYYWRGTLDTVPGSPANWKASSFLYNTSLSTGWNQSHYFQYLKNSFSTLNLKNDRLFHYPNTTRELKIRNMLQYDQEVVVYWDGYLIARNAWSRRGFIFFVYDANTGQNWQTYQIGTTCRGPYNDITCNRYPTNVIEFITNDLNTGKQERQHVIDFINSIPCNAYVLGYSFFNAAYSQWSTDSTQPGDITLFKAFEDLGVSKIRQQQDNVPFSFFVQKCNPSFNPIQIQRFPPQIIDTSFTFSGTWTKGNMESTIIGPAKEWKDFSMDWHSLEPNSFDGGTAYLYGYDTIGVRTLLRDDLFKGAVTPLSIDAKRYPFLQMQWLTRDDSLGTPPQMDHWRLYYDKAPEAVVNPTIHFAKSRDTILSGENFNMSVAVENVTPINMDSLLVRFVIKTASNNITTIYKRFAPLPGKSNYNIEFNYDFPGFNFFGLNYITVEVNPDEDQPEQFHFNNFAEFTVFVDKDRINPLFDVTFDGRHITDGEYVSSSPEILFRLKDENKYLALNDTSEFLIYMFYPNDPTNPVQIARNQADVTYIPANPANLTRNNEARMIYKPTLPDGTYEIRAQGIDRSKNDAGKYDYRIKFKVDSKPSITNVLNYPNPFSTSTQFVFTITGAVVPEQLIIQIFSASGKVVKEITREELGNLHIGNNLTDYKWDGTDNYGDRLANGVYFYRVMTRNIDGTTTEIKQSNIDKYFKHGYGKLYIIR
ncbi:MAG: C25 family cysteine peptidase [Chitinophagales bacterium]